MHKINLRFLSFVLAGVLVFAASCSVILHPAVLAEADSRASFPIIMYHHLTADNTNLGAYVLSVEQFEKDLQYLRDNGYQTLSVRELYAIDKGEMRLPEKAVMLTFDDGQESFYAYAYPLLKQYNMCAVMSVIGRYTEQYSMVNDHNLLYSHLNWAQLKEMSQSGLVEFGNHSYDMHSNSGPGRSGVTKKCGESADSYRKAVTADIEEFNRLFEKNVGFVPSIYTYPFGRFSKETEALVEEMGYTAVFTCYEKRVVPNSDKNWLLHLGRFNRPHGKSSSAFFKKILVM